jgi:hypothetical protein
VLRLHIGYRDSDEQTVVASYLECGSVNVYCVRMEEVNNVIYVVTGLGIIPNVNRSLEKKVI